MLSGVRDVWSVTVAMRGLRAQPIHNQRVQPAAEDAAENAFECGDRARDVHEAHCIECGSCVFAS